MKTGKKTHIIVLEFMSKKLAFLFSEATLAQRFLVCMELLVRKVQEGGVKGR